MGTTRAARADLSARPPRAVAVLNNHPGIDLIVGLGVAAVALQRNLAFGRPWLMIAAMVTLAYAVVLGAAVSRRPVRLFPNGLPSRTKGRLKSLGAHVLVQTVVSVAIALGLSSDDRPALVSAVVAGAVAVSVCAALRGIWLLQLTWRGSDGYDRHA